MTFFRAGLVEKRVADILLVDEVEFQRLYLAIEQARFGDWLSVEMDVPPSLGGIMLPLLVLQPLMKNAVKHGLGATNAPVTIGIRGHCEGGTIHLHLTDRASGTATRRHVVSLPQTGIALTNARARLATRFGAGVRLLSGAVDGEWDSVVSIPMAGTHG